ncbi:unnamed protein product [Oncorhynchus mykiss]|uniref:Protein Wnt n=1 Tax=Oncorhynchus mykiss TaxID=8022 RepID=A0A060WP51_ONCMY|nr:unnamed protein product [Oncorhynchus mykiss]
MGAMFTDTPMKAKRSRPQASTLMHHHNSELGRKALREALAGGMVCLAPAQSGEVCRCWLPKL